MIVWRIAVTGPDYRADDISGEGAKRGGGRWNKVGVAMTYCSSTLSLAFVETLVHTNLAGPMPRNRYRIEITIPNTVWRKRAIARSHPDWPGDWDAEPAGKGSIDFGTAWRAAGKEAILVVPSVAIPQEENILLNPSHADFKKITARNMGRMDYDPRLFGLRA